MKDADQAQATHEGLAALPDPPQPWRKTDLDRAASGREHVAVCKHQETEGLVLVPSSRRNLLLARKRSGFCLDPYRIAGSDVFPLLS